MVLEESLIILHGYQKKVKKVNNKIYTREDQL